MSSSSAADDEKYEIAFEKDETADDEENDGASSDFKSSEDASESADSLHSLPIMQVKLPSPSLSTRRRRHSVSAESDRPSFSSGTFIAKKIPKPAEAYERIRTSVKKSILFTHLDEQQRTTVFDAMGEAKVKTGDTVIKQGDLGDYFYVIESGKYEVFKAEDRLAKPVKVLEYNGAGSFGELALMYNCPRAATVIARSDGVLWRLDRETFRHIIIESTMKKRKLFEEFLEQVPVLTGLAKQERSLIADCLEVTEFRAGDYIIYQGEEGDRIFFIIKGKAVATQIPKEKFATLSKEERKKELEVEVGHLSEGQYFGERALLTREPRAANVIAVESMQCAVMDRSAFERLLGPVKELMERQLKLYKTATELLKEKKLHKQ